MWEDALAANNLCVEGSRERGRQAAEIHALDYLVYAYLQRGEDDKAGAIVEDINSRDDIDWRDIAFNAGAVAARHAMERHDWEEAASLEALGAAAKVGGNDETRNAVA